LGLLYVESFSYFHHCVWMGSNRKQDFNIRYHSLGHPGPAIWKGYRCHMCAKNPPLTKENFHWLTSDDQVPASVWTCIEPAVGIVAACLSNMRPLFKRIYKKVWNKLSNRCTSITNSTSQSTIINSVTGHEKCGWLRQTPRPNHHQLSPSPSGDSVDTSARSPDHSCNSSANTPDHAQSAV
jgi:hypothetical protein